jgi:phosphohistidine phosphatase
MLIYILRHGDAFSDINLSDSERPLTDTGTQQSSIAGTFLRMTKANVDLIVSSPLLRAKQTASVIQEQIGSKKPITSDLLLNGTDQLELFQYINKLGVSSLLLVGHIPHLEDTITSIINGNS